MNKISIITVCFNDLAGLKKTLPSVFAQKWSGETEIIVIDGGSSDGSAEFIKKYSDEIAFWCSEPDKGIFNAMNKAVSHATGDFCIFMNSGDCFASDDVLAKIFNDATGEIKNADIISGSTFYQKNDKTIDFGVAPKDVTFAFFYNKTLQHQSTFIRREWLLKYPYDESFKIVGDIKFWIQSLIFGNAKYAKTSVPVANFDLAGCEARAPGSEQMELDRIFQELNCPRIIADYEFILKKDRKRPSLRRTILRKSFKSAYYKWIYS